MFTPDSKAIYTFISGVSRVIEIARFSGERVKILSFDRKDRTYWVEFPLGAQARVTEAELRNYAIDDLWATFGRILTVEVRYFEPMFEPDPNGIVREVEKRIEEIVQTLVEELGVERKTLDKLPKNTEVPEKTLKQFNEFMKWFQQVQTQTLGFSNLQEA